MRKILIITCLTFLISCNENKNIHVNEDLKVIDLKERVVPKLSNFIKDNFELIPLESSDDCSIGIVNKIDICNHEIFVLDAFRANAVFAFDRHGKYLRKIDKKGKGPGEYIQLYSFGISNDGTYIYLYDAGKQKILKYHLNNFSFVKEYLLPFHPFSFEISENNDFIFYCISKQKGSLNYNVIVTTDEFKIKKKFLKQDRKKQYSLGLTSTNEIYKYDRKYVFHPLFSDTLYSLTSKMELHPYLRIDFGKTGIPPDDFFSTADRITAKLTKSGYVYTYYNLETRNSIFIKYAKKRKVYIGTFSKRKNIITASCLEGDVVDDIGLLSFTGPDFIYDDKYISILDPFTILSKKEKSENLKMHPKIAKLINTIEPSDNPVLMIFSTK